MPEKGGELSIKRRKLEKEKKMKKMKNFKMGGKNGKVV
jgi:hypothetical protein